MRASLVYSGFDTIQELLRVPTVTDDPSYKFLFEEPIHIIKVSILREHLNLLSKPHLICNYWRTLQNKKQQRELQQQQRVQQQAAAFNAAATATSNTAGAGTAAAANNNLNNGTAMGTQGGSYFVNNNPHAQAEQFANYGSNTVNQHQQQQQQHHHDPNANAAYQEQQQYQQVDSLFHNKYNNKYYWRQSTSGMSTQQSTTTILSAGKLLREFCPLPYAATYQSMNKIQEHNRHQQSTMQTSYILDSIR